MAAVFSSLVPIDLEIPAAVRTLKGVDGFALYLVKVAVPPGIPAFVTAEAFFLTLCYLLDFPPAILAMGSLSKNISSSIFLCFCAYIVSAAKGLHRVRRYPNHPGNLSITISGSAQFYNLRFLIIGHISSAPSQGWVSWYLPHSLPKKSTPTVMA